MRNALDPNKIYLYLWLSICTAHNRKVFLPVFFLIDMSFFPAFPFPFVLIFSCLNVAFHLFIFSSSSVLYFCSFCFHLKLKKRKYHKTTYSIYMHAYINLFMDEKGSFTNDGSHETWDETYTFYDASKITKIDILTFISIDGCVIYVLW